VQNLFSFNSTINTSLKREKISSPIPTFFNRKEIKIQNLKTLWKVSKSPKLNSHFELQTNGKNIFEVIPSMVKFHLISLLQT